MKRFLIVVLAALLCSCTQNVSEYEDKIDSLTQQLDDVTAQRNELEKKLAESKSQIVVLNTSLAEKNSQIAALDLRIKELEEIDYSSQIAGYEEEISSLREEKSQLTSEVQSLLATKADLEASIETLSFEIEGLRTDLSLKENQIDTLLSSLQGRKASLQQDLSEKTSELLECNSTFQGILSIWGNDVNFYSRVSFDWNNCTISDFIQVLRLCSIDTTCSVITQNNFVVTSIDGSIIHQEGTDNVALQGPEKDGYYWGPITDGSVSWDKISPKIPWDSSIPESYNDYINSQCSVNSSGLIEEEVNRALTDIETLSGLEESKSQLELDILVLEKAIELVNSELESLTSLY